MPEIDLFSGIAGKFHLRKRKKKPIIKNVEKSQIAFRQIQYSLITPLTSKLEIIEAMKAKE